MESKKLMKSVSRSHVHSDLFHRVSSLSYTLKESKPISLPHSHLGDQWGLWWDWQAPIPHSGCRCVEAILTLMGLKGITCLEVRVHVPGELWAHLISHTYTHTNRLLSLHPHAFMTSECTDQELLGPLGGWKLPQHQASLVWTEWRLRI